VSTISGFPWFANLPRHTDALDLLPLAVALPRMLERIEADLVIAAAAETRRLRQRARIDPRAALIGRASSYPRCYLARGRRLGSRSSGARRGGPSGIGPVADFPRGDGAVEPGGLEILH
jgi:hypothetical protein